jgi:hypothetical protein
MFHCGDVGFLLGRGVLHTFDSPIFDVGLVDVYSLGVGVLRIAFFYSGKLKHHRVGDRGLGLVCSNRTHFVVFDFVIFLSSDTRENEFTQRAIVVLGVRLFYLADHYHHHERDAPGFCKVCVEPRLVCAALFLVDDPDVSERPQLAQVVFAVFYSIIGRYHFYGCSTLLPWL